MAENKRKVSKATPLRPADGGTTEGQAEVGEEARIPQFRAGDIVKVSYKIREEGKERTQPFAGVVISVSGEGISKTFIVRKVASANVAVERIFPLYSPNIQKIEVVKKGKARRAKLYYLREKVG